MHTRRRNYSSNFIPILLVALVILLSGGCSSTTSVSTNNGQSSVTMQSKLTSSDVSTAMIAKGDVKADLTFDKIVVTRVRIFIKDIKLHSEADDMSKDDHDGTIKTGPFVLQFDSSGSHVVATSFIPPGTYDRVKFEIHKPNEHDADDAAVLALYPDFENGNQTYTVLIDGYTEKAGVRTYFYSQSSATYNLTVRFEDAEFNDQDNVVLGANDASVFAIEFDPRLMFHLEGAITGSLFDPRDSGHQKDIDDHLQIAIRFVRVS